MEKIGKLKDLILKHGLDGYIIPKNDEFFTEYVPNSKDKLKYGGGYILLNLSIPINP